MIALISSAHCTSHFLQLTLPPLFLFLKAEFDASYAAVGAIMSCFYVASALCQFAAGFAVDRFGARPVLLAGVALIAGCTALAAAAPGLAALYVLAALMGIGNGVFHPADFAILNARVEPRRLGFAYSIHGVGGSLGYSLAPLCSYAVADAFGWRVAVLAIGAAGLAVCAALALNGADLATRGHRGEAGRERTSNVTLFVQRPIVLCFLFFCLLTTGTVMVQTFAAPALNAAYGLSLAVATSAVTGYLLGSTTGMLAGGFLATRTAQHDRVAAVGLAIGAAIVMLIAAIPVGPAAVLPLFVIAGFALGATGPSRDMIVRAATPPGASGRTYGFVYSGLDIGATVAPVLAGAILDYASPRFVLAAIGFFLLAAMATVVQARRSTHVTSAPVTAAD